MEQPNFKQTFSTRIVPVLDEDPYAGRVHGLLYAVPASLLLWGVIIAIFIHIH